MKPAPNRRRRPQLTDIPPLFEFWKAVQRHKKLYYADVFNYKKRAPWAALLPMLSVGAYYTRARDVALIQAFPFLHRAYTYHNRRFDNDWVLEVFAFWELGRLIFDRRELPHFGRIERNLGYHSRDLSERIMRLHKEYQRISRILAYHAPGDLLAREFLRIRLQEIAAFFDAVSGGYWTKATGGLP